MRRSYMTERGVRPTGTSPVFSFTARFPVGRREENIMSIAEDSRFPRVFEYFEELTRIPRASGNTKAVSDFVVSFAQSHGLSCRQDEFNNVIVWKPASAGREEEPAVMLQGHLDMVAAVDEGISFDFRTDALRLRRDGDFLSAEGTTLGADDGIAVAMILAVLEDDTLSHPPLECVFTVDEELGMLGAAALDLSGLKAESLINLDCEGEGVLTVGCAGGSLVRLSFPAPAMEISGILCRISVSGLIGGHSGVEIHKNHTNANHLMGRILTRLSAACPCLIGALSGGSADNAIPSSASAQVLIGEADVPVLDTALNMLRIELEEEIVPAEPDFTLSWSMETAPAPARVSRALTELLPLFSALPDGVQAMSRDLPGLVETSLNLGTMQWDGTNLILAISVRSSMEESRRELEEDLLRTAQAYGGTGEVLGVYPGWPAKPDSRLVTLTSGIWQEMTGQPMRVEAIHAGLECGVFLSKMPNLDIEAMGPDLFDIHTTNERLSISSAGRVYDLLTRILARIR